MKKIAIIGSGSWGVALATYLANVGNQVKIWSFSEEERDLINNEKKCKFLPDLIIPENIYCSTSYEEVIKDTEFILHVTPSKFTRSTFKQYKQYVGEKPVIICSKGFEKETLKTLDEVIEEELPNVKVGVLSGPSHAEEVSIGVPTALVMASKYNEVLDMLQETFMSEKMRIYTSNDVKGVELGGALKNIIAFCAGVAAGIGLGDNSFAALITRGLKEISRTEFCVIDTEGTVLASTFADFSIAAADVQAFVESQADSQLVKGFQYFKVCDDYQLEYVLVAHGDDEDTYMVGKLAAFQIQNLIVAYKERFDKDSFIKNLLLDNLLLVDIYNRAKKLHIEADVRRVVMILELNQEKDHSSVESVKSLFGGKSRDFITAVDEKNIIIVKELAPGEDYAQMNKVAATILEAAGRDEEGKTHVAYGTIVKEIKEVSRSYKEARMAMDVGKIFSAENDIYAYSSLGIGRLIYQLPIPLCKMFIKEIFGNKSPDDFDEETLTTINKFFENSLNVSETSRQLYIHRNTLVYRLDKLQKSTGLYLRVFEDAITFKIALMVVQYMKYMETLDY